MCPRYRFERRNGEFRSTEEDKAHAGSQFIPSVHIYYGLAARCVPVVTTVPLVWVTCWLSVAGGRGSVLDGA